MTVSHFLALPFIASLVVLVWAYIVARRAESRDRREAWEAQRLAIASGELLVLGADARPILDEDPATGGPQ